ncbi:MAG: AAA family ATPase [Lactimicrobium sp.]|uniref:ATP-binding protein n=1 Tax=Lactimicrobium sp. TaxID=2563780 RepID=UPI002F35E95C
MIEGPRRVGKSTAAEEFAKNEFRSYIKVDFANITKRLEDVFHDIADLDMFFRRLQIETGVMLYKGESVIIFDEIQRAPLVRQAIKYLVADGRYYYIETGSLISIKKNVKDIVIPSEEHKIEMYPMDYEEFLLATGNQTYSLIREIYQSGKPVGETNRKLIRDFRVYMAVGGMPQAVEAYVNGASFQEIDRVKREIISLYEDDFRKTDNSGRISRMFEAIPSQLSSDKKRYIITSALNKPKTRKDEERLSDLLDSKTVLASYNTTDPSLALNLTKDDSSYKLFTADTGLFITLLFNDESKVDADIYSKLLSDRLNINLGYVYENMAAQMIASTGRKLYYHTWKKKNSTHSYEVDFLLSSGTKITPLEIKSSSIRFHDSISEFAKKYSAKVGKQYVLSQRDVAREANLYFKPIYMLPFILEDLS